MLPKLPPEAIKIIDTIKKAKGQAYLVGGALRDLLMNKSPHDWDFATTLTDEEILSIFPQGLAIGGNCGTVRVPFGPTYCEITPCRIESDYANHRKPELVKFVPNILLDLARRDFTINSMAYNGEVLLDPFGGQEDIRRKLLRCVGKPDQRFAEDPLRILRLFRFAATLGFSAEWNTFAAANKLMGLVALLSKERVRDEVQRILFSSGPQALAPLILKGGLQNYGFHFAPSLLALANVPNTPLCRWWALLAMCGAAPSVVSETFGFPRKFKAELVRCTHIYRVGPAHSKLELKQKIRNIKLDYAPIAAAFSAVSPYFRNEPLLFAGVLIIKEPYRLQDLAINGTTLQNEGIQGEMCGRILEELLDAVIKNPKLNEEPVLLGLARGLTKMM